MGEEGVEHRGVPKAGIMVGDGTVEGEAVDQEGTHGRGVMLIEMRVGIETCRVGLSQGNGDIDHNDKGCGHRKWE